LRELGYVVGENLIIEGRFYGDRVEQLPALAADLVRLRVDVIVAGATPAPETAKRATSTIPIVMASHPDPVGSGLVASLARPGGNVTGLSTLTSELQGKRLQLLREIIPRLSRVAVLSNPTVPNQKADLRELEASARSLHMQLQVIEARASSDLDDAFSAATRERAGALIVLSGSLIFFAERARLAELAAKSRLPTVYGWREAATVGGLMTYGHNVSHTFRRAALFVDKILKGANPADLPVEQPTKFELVINLKTAKALGLTIPPSLLLRADHVIE
jgi:putative ABC transport system substrate-binding protein